MIAPRKPKDQRHTVTKSRSGVLTVDEHGNILGADEHAADLFGGRIEDLLGKPLQELLPDVRIDHRGFKGEVRPDSGWPGLPTDPVRLKHHNGSERKVRLNASTVRQADGFHVSICLFTDEDSDQASRLLRMEVQELRARLAGVLKAAVDAIIITDHRGRIQEYNDAAERIFGYTTSEVIGENVSILMPDPHRSAHDDYIDTYLKTGKAQIIGIGREVVGRRQDGALFPMDLAVGEVKLGNLPYFVGIIRDISERKQVEQQLSRNEEQLRLAFQNLPIAKAVCDASGGFLRVNPAACSLWGYPEAELLSMRLVDIVLPEDQQRLNSTMLSLCTGSVTRADLFLRFEHPSGRIIYGHFFGSGIGTDSASGRRSEVVVQVMDQTDQVHAEEEARTHRERLAHVTRLSTVGEMAAGIAHEINQPLTAIATFAQACQRLLRSPEPDTEEVIDALDQVDKQALRAGEVIRRLRTMVRKRESVRERVDVNSLVRDIVKLAELDGRVRDYDIVQNLEPGLPRVLVDPVQIQQVVLNLVRNGREAMQGVAGEESQITVGSRRAGEREIEILVEDQGMGISAEDEAELFHPFYTTKGSGMGMGLSICLSIVAAHGGRLWFTRNPKQGTTFHFTLPIAMARHA